MNRILIADDHEMFRDLLRIAVKTLPDLEIVGEAGDGPTAVALAGRLSPDLVLLDYRMPNVGCFATLLRELHGACATARVIVLSGFASVDIARAASEGGARGYVLKATRLRGVFDAIEAVRAGGVWIDPGLPKKVFDAFQRRAEQADGRADGLGNLTRREREVLGCVAEGSTNRDIAHKLHVSEQTVKTHLTRIFAKLSVANRVAAALAFHGREHAAMRRTGTDPLH
jgi:DNA-binding NarL/FixJ family response regulator